MIAVTLLNQFQFFAYKHILQPSGGGATSMNISGSAAANKSMDSSISSITTTSNLFCVVIYKFVKCLPKYSISKELKKLVTYDLLNCNCLKCYYVVLIYNSFVFNNILASPGVKAARNAGPPPSRKLAGTIDVIGSTARDSRRPRTGEEIETPDL